MPGGPLPRTLFGVATTDPQRMTIPDELVQAAAEASCSHREAASKAHGAETKPCTACWFRAKRILQAAFAKLPECEAAVDAVEDELSGMAPGLAGEFDAWRDFFHDAAGCALAALARELGGQDE